MTDADWALMERRVANLEALLMAVFRRDARATYERACADGVAHAEAVQAALQDARAWTAGLDAALQDGVLRAVARQFEN
ncbi:hypothetical protein [Deinococcus maricopensis]|uniref:Tol-pal system protein YbgF n=1 Tax=Deinococcus maricopensis (strain DSM 21211 / LMG 22137 / NRRL B-23946 / LB-34) TaxID=709986 RepID=E8U8W4_DEIML|nr:hypothetical protein [Deinococcus maricopensis]ADV67503.1 tol-pal system protein YbgF [Deinococcus maricopensis DSM 21211]